MKLGIFKKDNEKAELPAEVQHQVDLARKLLEETQLRAKDDEIRTNLTYKLQINDSTSAMEKALAKVEQGKLDEKSLENLSHTYQSLKTVSEHIMKWTFDENSVKKAITMESIPEAAVATSTPATGKPAASKSELMDAENKPIIKAQETKTLSSLKKLSFASDYQEVAHERILRRLMETALDKNPGYGMDDYCTSAKEKIKEACHCPNAEVIFLVGGTQTNQFVIDTTLAPYEGVIAAGSGHVSVHEAGAIEYTGHKVITIPEHLGKIDAGELEACIKSFWGDGNHDHMVFPGMVYISHPTEFGTLYTKNELRMISLICHQYNIPLYMDGARLGYGLMSEDTDVTMADIAEYCDTFYIGGTKVGAMFGEAVVYTKNNKPSHIDTRIKQHGALLAKGWLLGLQFDTLFTDDLYYSLGANAIQMAMILKKGLIEKGYTFYIDSPTNQQFIIMENQKLKEFGKRVEYSFWEKYDDNHTVIRLATSWATTREQVDQLLNLL